MKNIHCALGLVALVFYLTGCGSGSGGESGSAPTTTSSHSPAPAPAAAPALPSQVLSRGTWNFTASASESQAQQSSDGSLTSRWTTSAPQNPGMYFQIDFGESLSFDRIELDVGNSPGDYPRGYAVYATNDPEKLGSPIASGSGAKVTRIDVPVNTARYVRIVSTGTDSFNFWSIAEINVFGWPPKNRVAVNIPPDGSVFDVKSLQVDFGSGGNKFSMLAASAGSGGEVELRLESDPGSILGRCFFHNTGSPIYFMEYECTTNRKVVGAQRVNLKFQDYSDPANGKVLKISEFKYKQVEDLAPSSKNRLNVYPAPPGVQASPYYELGVSKVNELNSSNLATVTNWVPLFGWFSECPLSTDPVAAFGGYFHGFVAGWSHTFTNIELDPSTPIVVKISRKASNALGAPAGPIRTAKAYPAHKVESVQVINGDVYVTMKEPAQISIDIDGQMDTRNAPRATPNNWDGQAFPYLGRNKGSHAVSIFANPVIEDKPKPTDSGVLVIKAGQKIPENLSQLNWTTLYFEPGVHKTSVNVSSSGQLVERRWAPEDQIPIISNRSYYIPGDAIVYGNFTDFNRATSSTDNVRVFGHGVVSGQKITHYKSWPDYPNGEYPDSHLQRGIVFNNATNSRIEGITSLEAANHNFEINGMSARPNSVRWTKVIGWRVNSDAASVGDNVIVEDSFFRTQDDGHYIGGALPLRRIVFWNDVNGQAFRADFATDRFKAGRANYLPKQIVIEDIDIVYARSVFSTGDPINGLIGASGGFPGATLDGGVLNTGQMVVFRNIRVSDPLPSRALFSFSAEGKLGSYAGFRFENVTYAGKPAFGWKHALLGGVAGLQNFVFDNVSIAGEKIDLDYVNNPVNFKRDAVFDLTFRTTETFPSLAVSLTRTAINGTIKLDPLSPGSNKVTVRATPTMGYKFLGWSGDLSGTTSTATFTMDRDKAITANFSPQ